MNRRKIFIFVLTFLSAYVSISSARKTKDKKDQETTMGHSEIQLNPENTNQGQRTRDLDGTFSSDGKFSNELQILKELGYINFTATSGSSSTTNAPTELTTTAKHRRKHKNHHKASHHRRGHTGNRNHNKRKRLRTRPTDILVAEDDEETINMSTVVASEEIRRTRTKPKSRSRSRSRVPKHLGIEREFTNGHSGHPHKHHHHRQERRNRAHSKKQTNLIDSTDLENKNKPSQESHD